MSEVLVSGKVDTEVEKIANRYITAMGSTQDAVIKHIWSYIADTGNIPLADNAPEGHPTFEQKFVLNQNDFDFCRETDLSPIDRMHTLQKKTQTSSFIQSLDEQGIKAELEKRVLAD